MFQRVLVPLDGSVRAEQALPVAARLARASGGTIVLLRVISAPFDFVWYSTESSITSPEASEEEHGRATRYLTQIASSDVLEGLGVVLEVVGGVAAEMILSVANLQQVDIIVMCRHGQTGIKHWLLGDVAHKVARHSSVPVLLVHEEAAEAAALAQLPAEGNPVRVMVPLDGSSLAETVLPPAIELSKALSAPLPGALHLVQVIFPPTVEGSQILMPYPQAGALYPVQMLPPLTLREDLPEEWYRAERTRAIEEAKAYLHTVAKRLRTDEETDHALQITSSVVIDPDVASALISMAAQGKGIGVAENEQVAPCAVIAMATHGRGGLARWVMGSVTERVLGATSIPLFVIRPQQMPEEREPVARYEAQVMGGTKA